MTHYNSGTIPLDLDSSSPELYPLPLELTQSHQVNLGSDLEFPLSQGVPFEITVTVYSAQTVNYQFIFLPQGSFDYPSSISEPIALTWEQSDMVETSSAVNNSALNNTTIEGIANRIKDPALDINALIDDIIGTEE